jgi:hypothetical protein
MVAISAPSVLKSHKNHPYGSKKDTVFCKTDRVNPKKRVNGALNGIISLKLSFSPGGRFVCRRRATLWRSPACHCSRYYARNASFCTEQLISTVELDYTGIFPDGEPEHAIQVAGLEFPGTARVLRHEPEPVEWFRSTA